MSKQEAIVLDDICLSVEGKKVARILAFFGARWRTSSTMEFLAHNDTGSERSQNCRLICSSGTFLRLIDGLECNPGCMQFWGGQVHSAFVYVGSDSEILQNLLQTLTGDQGVVLDHMDRFVGD